MITKSIEQDLYYQDFKAGNRKPKVIFKSGCRGKNIFTSNIISFHSLGQWGAAELSSGKGFLTDKTLYGVSVVVINPETGEPEHNHELGESFYSKKQAEEYIKTLHACVSAEEVLKISAYWLEDNK